MGKAIRRAVILDGLAITIAFAISFAVKFLQPAGTRAALPYATAITLLTASVWIISLTVNGAYRWSTISNGITDFTPVVRATVTSFLIVGTFSFLLKTEFSRQFVLVGFPLGLILMVLGRRWVRNSTYRDIATGQDSKAALLVLHDDADDDILDLLLSSEEVPVTNVTALRLQNKNLHESNIAQIMIEVAERGAQVVVLNHDIHLSNTRLAELSWQLDQFGIELLVVPELLGEWTTQLNLKRHRSLPLVQLDEPRLSDVQRFQKRILDLLLTIPTVLVLSPFLLLTAAAVRLTSPGPALYYQTRIGVNGQPFKFWKFRSMRVGADAERLAVLGRPDDEMADRYRNDPRITRFGRFIRRFSIDELPQLWNVLRGNMSLVGPRPMLPEEVTQLQGLQSRRHLAQPGLTGLWQISGRKETTWDERMQLDLYYINSWSIAGDIAIIAKTIRVIFSGAGSY